MIKVETVVKQKNTSLRHERQPTHTRQHVRRGSSRLQHVGERDCAEGARGGVAGVSMSAKQPEFSGCSRSSRGIRSAVDIRIKIALVVAAFFFAGCTSGVTRPPNVPVESHTPLSATNQVASVSLWLTDEAKIKAAESRLLNPDELLTYFRHALETSSLLNDATDKVRKQRRGFDENITCG
jgi:hypothetical protein